MQLAELGLLILFLTVSLLFIVRGGRPLAETRNYTTRAMLVPSADGGDLSGSPAAGARSAAILNASYLEAVTLRSRDFLFAEIDRHNLADVPELNRTWLVRSWTARVAAAYQMLRHAINLQVRPNGEIVLEVTFSDPHVAGMVLHWMVADLREQLRTAELGRLEREDLIANAQLMGISDHEGAIRISRQLSLNRKRILSVKTAPDFAFTLKDEAPVITNSAGFFWLSVGLLALLMVATLVTMVRRTIFPHHPPITARHEGGRRAHYAA